MPKEGLMRTLSLAIVAAALAVATPVLSEPCSTTVSTGVNSSFSFNELGQDLSHRAVVQLSGTYTCGDYSANMFSTSALSTSGRYGERSYADEPDFTFMRDHTYATVAGPVDIQLSIAYWKYAPFKSADANLVFASAINRPIEVRHVTLNPFLRLTQYLGLGSAPNIFDVHPGVRASLPLSKKWTMQTEVGMAYNFAGTDVFARATPIEGPASALDHEVPYHRHTAYATVSFVYDFGHDMSVTVAMQSMQHAPASLGLTFQKKF